MAIDEPINKTIPEPTQQTTEKTTPEPASSKYLFVSLMRDIPYFLLVVKIVYYNALFYFFFPVFEIIDSFEGYNGPDVTLGKYII